MSETAALPDASQAAIDRFIDALWIEDGLAAADAGGLPARPEPATPPGCTPGRRASGRQTASPTCWPTWPRAMPAHARHHGQPAADRVQALLPLGGARTPGAADPTLRLLAARQPLRVPRTLSEAQVDACWPRPTSTRPLGLRDRCMLELMYASGLRVSELVQLKTVQLGLNEGVLRVMGKGARAPGALRRRGRMVGSALPGAGACRDPRPMGRPAQ
jgi:integrase/recombinase XerD